MGKKTKEQLQSELDTIRELRGVPLTDKQIMKELNVPKSTYYWYLKLIREQDKKIIEKQLGEGLHTEMRQLYNKLIQLEQEALKSLDNEKITTRDKMEVINTIRGLAADRATLLKEGPEYLGYDIREKSSYTEEQEEIRNNSI